MAFSIFVLAIKTCSMQQTTQKYSRACSINYEIHISCPIDYVASHIEYMCDCVEREAVKARTNGQPRPPDTPFPPWRTAIKILVS